MERGYIAGLRETVCCMAFSVYFWKYSTMAEGKPGIKFSFLCP